MDYILITEDGRCGGIVGIEPTHNNWTNTPYLGGLIKEFWNGSEWIESATQEEIDDYNRVLNEELRQEYAFRISSIKGMQEAIEKKAIDDIPIPQEIIDERERLKQEYKQLTNKDFRK